MSLVAYIGQDLVFTFATSAASKEHMSAVGREMQIELREDMRKTRLHSSMWIYVYANIGVKGLLNLLTSIPWAAPSHWVTKQAPHAQKNEATDWRRIHRKFHLRPTKHNDRVLLYVYMRICI